MSDFSNTLVVEKEFLLNDRLDASSDEVQSYVISHGGIADMSLILSKALLATKFITPAFKRVDLSQVYNLMIASEKVLAKYWDTPEEDEAWDHL